MLGDLAPFNAEHIEPGGRVLIRRVLGVGSLVHKGEDDHVSFRDDRNQWCLDAWFDRFGLCHRGEKLDERSGRRPDQDPSALTLAPRLPTSSSSRVVASQRPVLACAVKRRRFPSGCKPHPANAPAGSNRSNYGGDEVVEAFGEAVTKYGDGASESWLRLLRHGYKWISVRAQPEKVHAKTET